MDASKVTAVEVSGKKSIGDMIIEYMDQHSTCTTGGAGKKPDMLVIGCRTSQKPGAAPLPPSSRAQGCHNARCPLITAAGTPPARRDAGAPYLGAVAQYVVHSATFPVVLARRP